jgi:predicted amidohydrolase YtcJ
MRKLTTNNYADIVLTNGVVFTADAGDTVCEAVAIRGETILAVGGDREIRALLGPKTRTIDLKGKMVIPGMIDTHIHPPGLSLSDHYEVQLSGIKTLKGYLEEVRRFIARNPAAGMVYGRGWSWGILKGEESTKGPRKEYLDEITRQIPVVLRAHDGHTLWVNSKALEVNGLTKDTVTPRGGVIEKDPVSGELWGTLKEWAMSLIALPAYSLEQYTDAMAAFQKKMHRFGVTGVLCMGSLTLPTILEACAELQKRGQLQLRFRGVMTVNAREDLTAQLVAIHGLQARYSGRDLKVTAAKFFTDGVIEGGTSFLLEPYTLEAGKGPGYHGDFLWDIDRLKQAFYAANQAGLQIHVHSTGDASTRKVLDALEYTRSRLPGRDCRNTITHLQLVDAADIPRFKELGVIASVQPYWQFKGPNWWHNVDYRFLGERAEREFPLGSFFASGATGVSSSDYPATSIPDPLLAIDTGVTRNMARGALHGVEDIIDADDARYLLGAGERATVRQMIRSFTASGAFALFLDNETGSIEAGKLADLVVLDRDILTINPVDIDKAEVVMTFFGGKMVYQK